MKTTVDLLRDRLEQADDPLEAICVEDVLVAVQGRRPRTALGHVDLDAIAVLEAESERVDLGVAVRVELDSPR